MEKFNSSAKVIDGTLILTLPDAIRPVVWQMQLGQTKSSALEVREQNEVWMLLLKTPRMDVMEIAPFANKDKAVKALLAVSRAMEKAHGQIAPAAPSAYPVPAVIPQGRFCWLWRVLRGILYAFLALVLLLLLVGAYLRLAGSSDTDVPPSQTAAAPDTQLLPDPAPAPQASPAETTVGKPVSADDYLNNQ